MLRRVGLELGSVYAALGSKVTVVEALSLLSPGTGSVVADETVAVFTIGPGAAYEAGTEYVVVIDADLAAVRAKVVHAGNLHDVGRHLALARPGERGQGVGVACRHLGVEFALHDEQRLAPRAHAGRLAFV